MKILFISSYLPFPLHSGGQVRLYNLIKELSEKHEITLVCEKRIHQTVDDISAVEKICKKVITVPRKKQWSLQNFAKAATSTQSFLVTGHTHLQMQREIITILAEESFDVIHVETFYVMQNLPKTSIPIVLVDHNIEYSVYQKFSQRVPTPLRPLLSLDIAKIKREEVASWRRATHVVAVSYEDQSVMKKEGITASIVPNGVNIDSFSFEEKQEKKQRNVLFIGDFSWVQNRDSAEFIIQEIWPKVLAKRTKSIDDIKLWIVGRKIPGSIRTLTEQPSVVFDEESSALSAPEIFKKADILLAPIRVGGGTSYKILESMSCGTPVVTMSMSAQAIGAVHHQDLLVGSTAEELAHSVDELLTNRSFYERVAKNGRALIEKHYNWKMIGKHLEAVYQGVIQ